MPAVRTLSALVLLAALSACDSAGPDQGETTGVWAGTAEFKVDSLLAGQNFRIITDYETRYEFELVEDENSLVLGFLNQYNTGTFTLREPRRDENDAPFIREKTFTWDGDLVQSWPVYGTYDGATLEVDLPEAEEAEVFPKDLWTFTVVGSRARLASTRIQHGYTFNVWEDQDSPFTMVLSPTTNDEFSVRRQ